MYILGPISSGLKTCGSDVSAKKDDEMTMA